MPKNFWLIGFRGTRAASKKYLNTKSRCRTKRVARSISNILALPVQFFGPNDGKNFCCCYACLPAPSRAQGRFQGMHPMRPFPGRNRTKFRGLRTRWAENSTESGKNRTKTGQDSTGDKEKRTPGHKGQNEARKQTIEKKWISCTKMGRNARKSKICKK